jgi:uncharacterized protein YdhG (YjbR/CyaY superfamily)
MPAAPNVDAYLAGVPKEQREALQTLRERLFSLVPDAGERISYAIPTITYRGKGLLAFGSRKDGCSLYLMSTSTAAPLSAELSGFEIKGTTVWFTPGKPLTLKALRAVVKHRMSEVDARLDRARR